MTSLRALLAHNIKEKRQALGLSQEKLAEKVSTSTNYIAQIEQKNRFPTPTMLERIAAALEIDSPQLFSIDSYTDEALHRLQESVQSDIEKAVAHSFSVRIAEFKTAKPSKKRVSKKPK
jgi:transcriptional regulator with XRE-family HTH domain